MSANIGLDIGSESIKIVQLIKQGNKFELQIAARGINPTGGFLSEEKKDLTPLAQAIKKLKSEAKISGKQVVCSLPERRIFTQVIELPKMTESELEKAIPWEAENIVPQPLAEVNLDWEILDNAGLSETNKIRVLLIAAPKVLVKTYLDVLEMAELEPVVVETELLAINRALSPVFGQKNILILNCGEKSSDLLVTLKGNFFMSRSFPSSGEAITRAVSVGLGLDFKVAEEYKKTYGLSNEFEGKINAAIEPILLTISNEIKKAMRFFEEKTKEQLSLLVLTGGPSLTLGITEYFAKSLGIEVQVADPFSILTVAPQILQTLKKDSPLFSVSVGLAMREV